jgi:hypothetical protein
MFDGIERDNRGWADSNCIRPGCNHPLCKYNDITKNNSPLKTSYIMY